jgi:uncharacterized protein YjbI with pentapeptide repeats
VTFAAQQRLMSFRLQIGGDLDMSNSIFGGGVDLYGATVLGNLDISGATLAAAQKLDGSATEVGGSLALHGATFDGPVDLSDANVHGGLVMGSTTFGAGQQFTAYRLQVGGDVGLLGRKFDGGLDLRGATLHGNLALDGVRLPIGQHLQGEQLQVGRSITTWGAELVGVVSIESGNIGRHLDLRGATLWYFDLSGTTIDGDLRLSGSGQRVTWIPANAVPPSLFLRNVKIANLQDDEGAWPPTVIFEGFTYLNLGGTGEVVGPDAQSRKPKWWRRWLELDPFYSSQPYTQLASVLAASGNRGAAASVRFFGRDRERREALAGCVWLQQLGLVASPPIPRPCNWQSGLGLSILQFFVGYGIGGYSFRALDWAIGLTLVGTFVLQFAPGVRGRAYFNGPGGRGRLQKSPLWCFGASLSHLLPVVSLSPEFTDFFNDPKRQRLRAWQQVAFAILAVCGWALGLFVAAAFSGLTQT